MGGTFINTYVPEEGIESWRCRIQGILLTELFLKASSIRDFTA